MRSKLPVLVLEADGALQRLLQAVLRGQGYDLKFVPDGSAALPLLDHNFAALIVDVSIAPSSLERGARGGIGLIHYLQHRYPGLLPRTLVLTALSERDLPPDLAGLRLLQKPFDVSAVREALAHCVAAGIQESPAS